MTQIENIANDEEIGLFEQAVQSFLASDMDADRFTATRLQMGVYGQRQEGVNMVRIKVPGGRLNPTQLNAIADVLVNHSEHDVAHITTRQDIQVHYIPLAHTPAVLRRLADSGLTTREACGNTVRNVTACPLAGVCPREHVDVTTHLDGAVLHFLRNPLNQQLPRKFKISFSGCEADCAQGMMHDLGVVAARQGTHFGFKVLAGGGLGHKPRQAIVVEPFIEEKDLLPVMEAIIALHNRYSDRSKRAKSRIKFLVDRFGPEGFIEKYREELSRTKSALAPREYPQGNWSGGVDAPVPGPGAPRAVYAQKQAGQSAFPIGVPLGDLTGPQLHGIAALVERHGLRDVRTTQDQNLMLLNVPQAVLSELRTELAALGLHEPQTGDNVVACPGTSTCRLGITSSMKVAPKLNGGAANLRIRVSGCHNGCAQPETGDIGIYGEGKRLHGKLLPHYQTYFGGNGMAGGGLAIKGPSIPTARIETAIERVKQAYGAATAASGESFFVWAQHQGQAYFKEFLADLTVVKPEEMQSILRDHGTESDFKVLQLGGGECAGASQLQIGSDFFEAAHERNYRDALLFQRKYPEAAKCAEAIVHLLGQAVTQLAGGKKLDDLTDQAEELARALPAQPPLSEGLARFAQALSRPEDDFTEASLSQLFRDIDAWTLAAAEFCLAREPQLDLSGALPKARGVRPLNFHRLPVAAVSAGVAG